MLLHRPRRNRRTSAIRSLVEETYLAPSDLIYPLFVREGEGKEAIESMPGIYRYGLNELTHEVESALSFGIGAVALFPIIDATHKNEGGSYALNERSIGIRALMHLKATFPSLCVIADIALDPFTSHGHDGVLNAQGEVDNDKTVEILVKMALIAAEAGVDIVAPSDMMDGRVGALREALEVKHHKNVGILAYSAKYASSFYTPFRSALGSTLFSGDKKSYQLNPKNRREALREALLDEKEGADIIMVKPALAYLDVIAAIKEATPLPLAAYHVSGEYSMIMAAAERGWLNSEDALLESMVSIKRAGADMILTYAAPLIARLIT